MIKSVSREQLRIVRRRLSALYGGRADKLLERFFMMIGRYGVGAIESLTDNGKWDERDSVLITYADTVRDPERGSPLNALTQFSNKNLKGAIRTIHLLPFYPWSSDDGFSVIDYRKVAEENGTWSDVEKLGKEFDLMFDLVLNHCSAKSSWFKDFVAGIEPARHYFLDMDPDLDYSDVVRPRTSPLLTTTRTRDGDAHVWTTFSADQVDLNWQNPDVLFEFIDILFLYISMGMRIVRFDAVAFCWKQLGTNCIHLPETHEIVKLFHDIIDIVAPRTILLTETNVPHEENVSYFGYGDEAHMVYQFSLPPLLLHGLATGNASYLTRWASELAPPPEGCTFFNFTASHDGVGVRPVEGLLPEKEKMKLIKHVEQSGGKINWRTMPDGSKQPYELNVTYFSALANTGDPELGVARFLCSQALMLSLRGIPGIYFHSLVGTENDLEGVESSGINRRINRHKYDMTELKAHLSEPKAKRVFDTYLKMLRRRAGHPAFHPDAEQHVFDIDPELFVHSRISLNRDEVVFCIYNFSDQAKAITNPADTELLKKTKSFYDILSGKTHGSGKKGIKLAPYQALWLVPRS
ncbi:alpha-amylase family glycosyl hydrolase [Coraliomargarita parva]|uniref:alpha-amylase family glycosyl hydrolase n=1 Tax=Coraliomargarita parva TaxID=3014050 RepID=UPI0022B2B5BE|nr:alpha-amylase family glycosyl hydrolase [Coraliomargarita parva]